MNSCSNYAMRLTISSPRPQKSLGSNCICIQQTLTNGVDIEKAHRSPEDGAEHAVVKVLRGSHQHMEEEQTTEEAKHDRSCC